MKPSTAGRSLSLLAGGALVAAASFAIHPPSGQVAAAAPVVLQAGSPAPMSAAMLRRVAEAADALRDGRPYWYVVNSAGQPFLSRAYTSLDSANNDPMVASGYRVIGPVVTPTDFGLSEPVMLVCDHLKRPYPSVYFPGSTIQFPIEIPRDSVRLPGDSARNPRDSSRVLSRGKLCPAGPFKLSSILRMDLVIRLRNETVTTPIDPRQVDALFFDVSVFDKFLADYYTRLYGPAFAQELRDSLQAATTRGIR
jgi:hypothetical protein